MVVGVDELAGGLCHGLEHHDAGEDGEAGEMVLEILLGAAHMLERDDVGVGAFDDAVDEVEVHG